MPPGADDGGLPERHASEARRRLEAIRRALNADIAARLTRLNQRGGALASEKDDLDAARRVRAQVIALLREDGLPVVIAAAEAQVMAAVDDVLRDVPRVGPRVPISGTPLDVSFDAEAKASIARSVSGVLDEVTAVFRDGQREMQRAIDLGVSSNASLAEVTQAVADAIEVTFSKAGAAVETAVMGAGRLALMRQAERGGEAAGEEMLFLYDGPDDGKVREFCADNVGKVFTMEALKALDNGTGFPVVPYLGGVRCRHRASPITREDAVAEGYEIVEA